MKYNTSYIPDSNGYLTSKGFPSDVRLVQSLKSDLTDVSKFGSAIADYRYMGMIVSVIEDPDENNNGVYYLKDDPTLTTITNNSWIKIGDVGQVSSFTFKIKHPFASSDDIEYHVEPDENCTTEMTLQNHYNSGNNVADVIAVKDSSTIYHLMINPELTFVLDGGSAQPQERIVIEIDPNEINIGSNDVPESGLGIKYLYDNSCIKLIHPNYFVEFDYYVRWYTSLENLINNPEQYISPSQWNDYNIYNSGESSIFYCYALHENPNDNHGIWLDSLSRAVKFSIYNDSINITTWVTNITRTTSEANYQESQG